MNPFTSSCALARSSSFLRACGTVMSPVRSRRFSPPFLLNMGRPRGQKILGERQARRQRRLVPSCCGPTRRWRGPAHERRVLHAGAGGRGPLSAGSLDAMRIRRALLTVAALVLVAILGAYWFLPSMCANELVSEIRSPDGMLKVVVFQRDCGATTAASIQASVVAADAPLPSVSPRTACDGREDLSRISQRGRHGQMASAERVHRQGSPSGR